MFVRDVLFGISIPSGAIKRAVLLAKHHKFYIFQFLLVRLRGQYAYRYAGIRTRFQFLLVRLRVNRQIKIQSYENLISIPSGAIKSKNGALICYNWSQLFQFLLVRLRV